MKDQPFRHIGGAIVADHGAVALTSARALSKLYQERAAAEIFLGRTDDQLKARARSLDGAIAQAVIWRRAAGWTDPEAADRSSSL